MIPEEQGEHEEEAEEDMTATTVNRSDMVNHLVQENQED